MSSYITFGEKYRNNGKNNAFWVKTFKNAFTYSYEGGYIKLMAWDGETGEFYDASEEYDKYDVKCLRDGTKCYRINMDNNLKLVDDKLQPYTVNVDGMGVKYVSYSNPFVIRIGTDNYLVYKIQAEVSSDKKKSDNIKKVLDCCINMFGDAINRVDAEYYWNDYRDSIDTTYERYSKVSSLELKYSNPFKILYEPHGCRVDKYKKEDSSYIADRYF